MSGSRDGMSGSGDPVSGGTPGGAAPSVAPREGTRICRGDEIAEGASRKFHVRDGERDVECFVVRFRGALHAWVNECRHIAMTLDWVENQFFTEDGDYLMCPTHGAWYRPDDGECVAGPPCGKSLHRVPLVERGGEVFALPPEWR